MLDSTGLSQVSKGLKSLTNTAKSNANRLEERVGPKNFRFFVAGRKKQVAWEVKSTIKDNSLQFWMIKIPKNWKHTRLGEITYFFNQLHL